MADCDAVVVGAGLNGLAAALCLADAGWRVVVLERAARPGGAVKTEAVTLPGFRHDLYATNLSLFASSPLYRAFRDELGRAGLRFLFCEEAYASAYADGRYVGVCRDPERTEAAFARCSARDREGWRELVATYRRIAPHVLPFTEMALPSRDAFGQAVRMLRHLGPRVLDLGDVVFGSPRRLAERFFATEEAMGVVLPWAFHLDFGPDVRGGAAFAFVASASAHLNGLVLAEGGASAVVEALTALIAARGGEIRTGTEVGEIVIEGGRATGVRTRDGETVTASRAVIANVTPRALFGKLVAADALPSSFLRRAAGYRYSPGAFLVHLALSEPLAWRGGEELARFGYVHVNAKPDDIAATYAQCTAGLLPSRPMIIVSQPSHTDPSRAPAGRSAIRLQVRAAPAAVAGDAAGAIRQRDWDDISEPFADRAVDLLAEHAPNVRNATLARHVVSPLDLERENPNLVGGDTVSGSHHLSQNYLRRPFRGWTRYRTPVERLYMAGAFTWPGGGVSGASGYLLAQDLLRRPG